MVLHVNHFAVVTKNYFSKQSQHEDTKAEAITANFIETGFETGNLKLSGGNVT